MVLVGPAKNVSYNVIYCILWFFVLFFVYFFCQYFSLVFKKIVILLLPNIAFCFQLIRSGKNDIKKITFLECVSLNIDSYFKQGYIFRMLYILNDITSMIPTLIIVCDLALWLFLIFLWIVITLCGV